MSKIRVLVVAGTAAVRWFVSGAVKRDPALELSGAARDGPEALDLFGRCKPDVVALDANLPGPGGLETLAALRALDGQAVLLVFSRAARRDAGQAAQALSLGAADHVTLPEPAGELERAIEDQLLPRIKALGRIKVGAARPTSRREPAGARPTAAMTPTRVMLPAVAPSRVAGSGVGPGWLEAVGIGTSTGGPNALTELLAGLGAGWRVPTFIVQHMPPAFTGPLARRLAVKSGLDVREAAGGELVAAGQVWLAPGDRHMELRRDAAGVRVVLQDGPKEHSCRPAVDVLFRSLAAVYGGRVLAVVLTGMGKDGLAGCEQIRAAGGQVVVQDEATSVVAGMPGSVARAGLAEAVLPLGALAAEMLRRTASRASVFKAAPAGG